jgi:hypothetical protein
MKTYLSSGISVSTAGACLASVLALAGLAPLSACSASGTGGGSSFNPSGGAGGDDAGGAGGSEGGSGGSGGSSGKGGSTVAPCAKGTILCEDKLARVCDGEGGYSTEKACESLCLSGKGCVACAPGTATCEGGVSSYCVESGAGFEQEVCDPEMGLACGADGRCKGDCSRVALGRSYIGCEYFPTVTSNAGLYDGFEFAVAVANTGLKPASIRLTRGGKSVDSRTIEPGALETIKLPWVKSLKNDTSKATTYAELDAAFQSALVPGGAYELKSDQPVTVYQFNPLDFQLKPAPAGCPDQLGNGTCNSFTNDASLLLPSNTMSREYVAASSPTMVLGSSNGLLPPQYQNTPGLISITATQADTTVTVAGGGAAPRGPGVKGMKQGEKQTFKMSRGDVLQLLSAKADPASPNGCKQVPSSTGTRLLCPVGQRFDLTGSLVTSDKPVQVIGGHDCTFMPYTDFACDHIEESIFPLDTWGNQVLVTAPQAVKGAAAGDGKPDKQVVRVISGADGNMITLDPELFPGGVLNKGQYADVLLTDTDFAVKGTGPLLVVQYMAGGDVVDPANSGTANSKGDPGMSLGVPSEQFRSQYQFLAPATYSYNFVNVIAGSDVTVRLDGQPIAGTPSPIGQSGYSVTRVPISGGAHSVDAPKPFGIVVYGYGAYTSYMYPGGLDLQQLVEPEVK